MPFLKSTNRYSVYSVALISHFARPALSPRLDGHFDRNGMLGPSVAPRSHSFFQWTKGP